MSNPEIAKYYLALQPLAHPMLFNATRDNILNCLQDYFQGNFAWEVTNESVLLDGTVVSTTVMVYTPGRVYTGRASSNIKDYATNHLEALLSACRPLIENGTTANTTQSVQTTQQAPQAPQNGNMTPEQIMAAVGGRLQQSAPQPQQQQSNPNADLPFYFGPNDPNAPEEVRKQAQESLPPQYRDKPLEYYQPDERIHGYSRCQWDRMIAFKKAWGVTNDSMMTNYIHMWKPNLPNPTFNEAITPNTIDEFLAWTDRLGKQDC